MTTYIRTIEASERRLAPPVAENEQTGAAEASLHSAASAVV